MPERDLPLEVVSHEAGDPAGPAPRGWFRERFLFILLVPVLMFTGAVLGMYFQSLGAR